MRDEPSPELIALLERLRLADGGQLQSVAPQVRRLAGELPLFQSVWVDALAQARILTPFQAAEINAGRCERLVVGPYVLNHALPRLGYAACYAARHVETGRAARMLIAGRAQQDVGPLAGQLKRLVEVSRDLNPELLGPIDDAGIDQGRVWATCAAIDGQTAADWMVENGRFPPGAVLEMARQMLAGLLELEQRGLLHGDLGPSSVILAPGGRIALPHPALRPVVRPAEGYAYNDLPPEGYDGLAPERIADGIAANTAADIYACGCLWWHLLTGRPPFAGGNSMAKLCAIQSARVVEVRKLAPETPEVLAAAIGACMSRDPPARPGSVSELHRLLGPSCRQGTAELADCIAGKSRHDWASAKPGTPSGKARALATTAVCLLTIAAGSWPIWRDASIFARRDLSENPQTAPAPQPADRALAEHSAPPRQDRNVMAALYEQPLSAPRVSQGGDVLEKKDQLPPNRQALKQRSVESRSNGTGGELLLAVGRALRLNELNVRKGQTVHGQGGRRPLVQVPAQGLLIESEDTCFEDIDFVWDQKGTDAHTTARPAILVLAARQIEFRGCSFHCRAGALTRPVAIAWVEHGSADPGSSLATSGELVLGDCVFSRVAAAVDCRTRGALSVEVSDTLNVASGPLVRLNRCPQLNEPLSIALDHVTLRGCGGVLEYRYRDVAEKPGEINVAATDSAFVLNDGEALLAFEGPDQPDRLLKSVQWNGQGCLLAPDTVVAAWHRGGQSQRIQEDQIEVGGLVRSRVEFAGPIEIGPRACRITRWQVPLRSADPPGAGRHLLFLGE